MNESNQKIVFDRIWKPILEHKVIFLVCLSFSILLWVGVVAFISPVYESQALLQVGIVHGDAIEEMPVLENRLRRVLSQRTLVVPDVGRIVRISARSESAEMAQKDLIGITDQILNRHDEIFRSHYEPQVAYQKYLSDELARTKKQLDELGKKLESSRKSGNTKATMISLRKVDVQNGFRTLKDIHFQLSSNLLANNWQPTVLLQDPTFPENPIRPKPLLYLSLAVVLGLALGLFSVFYAHTLRYTTTKLDEKKQ